MNSINIKSWVKNASNTDDFEFRAAVHTLLLAISKSDYLKERMYIKGGLLLDLRYKTGRFTKDADFSTSERYDSFDKDRFFAEIDKHIADATESLEYDLDFRRQRCETNPKGVGKSFHTLTMKIGYARKGTSKHTKLAMGESPNVLAIDYSFNEETHHVDTLRIDENELFAYSLTDLTAEKFRSIIQQTVRKRTRRQDAYDIFLLLRNRELHHQLHNDNSKKFVLMSLRMKSESRGLQVDIHSLRNPEVVSRSKADYNMLALEITGELAPFEDVYDEVRKYYESLPWRTSNL